MLIQTIKKGNEIVNIHDDYIPKNQDEQKKQLKSIYDTLNIIRRDSKAKGINIDDWFFTESELEEKKQNKSYLFI